MIKQDRKQLIIELSKEFGIVTPYTSYIAIEERTEVRQLSNSQIVSVKN